MKKITSYMQSMRLQNQAKKKKRETARIEALRPNELMKKLHQRERLIKEGKLKYADFKGIGVESYIPANLYEAFHQMNEKAEYNNIMKSYEEVKNNVKEDKD